MRSKRYMVFDVESIGLHGEGFAFGYVVITQTGRVLEEGIYACPTLACEGTDEDRIWVGANIEKIPHTHVSPMSLRNKFWAIWTKWRGKGALLVTDYGWPVEARFLNACVDDYPEIRGWTGPLPLVEVSTVLITKGQDPNKTRSRLDSELPIHNPLADARQSARIFLDALTDRKTLD